MIDQEVSSVLFFCSLRVVHPVGGSPAGPPGDAGRALHSEAACVQGAGEGEEGEDKGRPQMSMQYYVEEDDISGRKKIDLS